MGVGKFMIKSAMAIWPTAYAKVKHGNIASDKLNCFRNIFFVGF